MSKLICTYEHDGDPDDDFGWLSVEVSTERFSARGGFWVQWQDVVEFAESLKQYPISPANPVRDQWGYEMQEGDDLILSIEIAAENKTGDLVARLEVADSHFPKHRLRTSFVTSYAEVSSFASALSAVMAKTEDEAVLVGR